MAKITTLWEKRKPFGQTGLELWTAADNSSDGSRLYDLSGKNRDLINSSAPPTSFTYPPNGLNELYFDGTKNPLSWTGAITLKHLFVVAAIDGLPFSGYRGLLSDISGHDILIGNPATSNFYGGALPADTIYRKLGVDFALGSMTAPPTGQVSVIEMIFPSGYALDGLQIGRDGTDTATKFKGWFGELICFSTRKGYLSRMEIYRYLAEKWFLFRETSDGKKIFPFPNNHVSPFSPLRYRIQSPALPNGKMKTRIKGSKLQQFDFQSANRRQSETDAVEYFETNYFDGRAIAVENNSFYPPRTFNVVPTSDIAVEPQSINLFAYKWSGRQTDASVSSATIDFDEIYVPLVPEDYYGLLDDDGYGLLDDDGYGLLDF